MKAAKAAPDVEAYIEAQEPVLQPMLHQIRDLIRKVAPDAAELISYHIPCYRLEGMLVGFGTHKKGCSFYCMSTTILTEYAAALEGFDFENSTLHLPVNKKLPMITLKKIIRQRMQMNREKTLAKKHIKNR